MTRRPTSAPALGARKQHGLGLVEVMVAMTIGLILLGGVGYMFIGSKQMNTTQTDIVRIQESTRNVLDIMGTAVRQAGYRLNTNLPAISADKISGRTVGGSDILIVRHDPNWVVDAVAAPAVPNRFLGRESNCEGVTVTSDNALDPAEATPQVNNNLVVYQFRVVDGQLRCYADDADAPAGNGVVVADHVERMKISYGIGKGGEVVDKYVEVPTAEEFAKVSAVRVNLLMRGPSKGVVIGTQKVQFNGEEVSSNDGHLRRVVTSTFTVRNGVRF
ncbi:prepilin-type N-terminal cleavage/methylation domain-containing protein [Massilia atriviolacea]|uniref:Prepilin-type N-terminal cleavage/methylation domain-containing protein n=1 Tax=Massilia atriviolacea TaxID=2495579 RepID=A0A430HSU5_9BURK|nr:PilW family protein [Massilia atriviolacea]RSZ60557.1 prepilin-type N-terminal cleavage/methylation domain-containing protein [Massilia atriviolacea]